MNGNGNEEFTTGNPIVDAALKRLNGKYKELEDAMIVQSQIERRQSEQLKTHAGLLASHDELVKQHAEWWRSHQIAMQEFDGKLNALIKWWMKDKGLPEAGNEGMAG